MATYSDVAELTWGRLAQNVQAAMKSAGLTQRALAQAMNVNPSAISLFLGGHRRINALEVALISDATGVPVDELLSPGYPAPARQGGTSGR